MHFIIFFLSLLELICLDSTLKSLSLFMIMNTSHLSLWKSFPAIIFLGFIIDFLNLSPGYFVSVMILLLIIINRLSSFFLRKELNKKQERLFSMRKIGVLLFFYVTFILVIIYKVVFLFLENFKNFGCINWYSSFLECLYATFYIFIAEFFIYSLNKKSFRGIFEF